MQEKARRIGGQLWILVGGHVFAFLHLVHQVVGHAVTRPVVQLVIKNVKARARNVDPSPRPGVRLKLGVIAYDRFRELVIVVQRIPDRETRMVDGEKALRREHGHPGRFLHLEGIPDQGCPLPVQRLCLGAGELEARHGHVAIQPFRQSLVRRHLFTRHCHLQLIKM